MALPIIEHFNTESFFGFRTHNDDITFQIQSDTDKTSIEIKINNNIKNVDIIYIREVIAPNFSFDMFYYVMYNFLKYNNYKIDYKNGRYTFEGYYTEEYDQSDNVHIKFEV